MKKNLLSILGIFCASLVFGQMQMNLPVTFDDSMVEYGVIGFEGAEASSIEADPTNAANTVVKVIKSATAQPWAGTTVTNAEEEGFSSPAPFSAGNAVLTARVWCPNAGTVVRMKIEDHLDPTISVETDATTTLAGQWETLTFNFENEGAGTAAINFDNNYNKLSMFFNYGTPGSATGEQTYYFDDIEVGEPVVVSTFNVLFKVDMSQAGVTFNTPEVNGTFNNWCGGCAPMSDADGDNIWELTIPLEAGTYEFKYAYDNWAGSENLIPGSPCTVTNSGFTNRSLVVTGDMVMEPVCYGFCEACTNVQVPVNVTFAVDMTQYTGTYTTPEVNGTFNNWCGGCAPMSDANGDDIWELTIPLTPGNYEFKFAVDNWADSEQLAEGLPCTITTGGFTNRVLVVEEAETLSTVCWASCEACIVSVEENETNNWFTLYPNPSNDVLFIQNNVPFGTATVRMFDLSGKLVLENQNFMASNGTLSTEALSDGLYTVQIILANGIFTSKVAVRH
jgi:hypothetical protein